MDGLPRTDEGGFQHITSDSVNHQELWDDTLFMTVLFLANLGRILNRREYIAEAKYSSMRKTKVLEQYLRKGLQYQHERQMAGLYQFRLDYGCMGIRRYLKEIFFAIFQEHFKLTATWLGFIDNSVKKVV
jgi:hypothetical protein